MTRWDFTGFDPDGAAEYVDQATGEAMYERLPVRRRLAYRRPCEAIAFEHAGIAYVGKVSRFPDSGTVAEVFLSPSVKSGTALAYMAQALAVIASIALQRGAPVEELAHALPQMDDGKPGDPLGKLLDLIRTQEGET